MLGGGYQVLSTKIFFAVVGARHDLGNAATPAMILLSPRLFAFWLQMRWPGGKSYVTVTGKSDAGLAAPVPQVIKVAAIALIVPCAAFTVGVHLIVVGGGFVADISRLGLNPAFSHLINAFSFEWGQEGLRFYGSAWESPRMTILVSAMARVFTTIVGILTA